MFKPIATVAAIACLTSAAAARPAGQTAAPAAPAATASRSGGLAGLLGGAGIPDIASVGAGNAAGLLGYCLKNNLLGAGGALGGLTGATRTPTAAATPGAGAGGAQSILQRLAGRQGVTTSPGYAAGQAGQVQTGSGQALSLDSLRGQVKSRVCSLVLSRAKSFL